MILFGNKKYNKKNTINNNLHNLISFYKSYGKFGRKMKTPKISKTQNIMKKNLSNQTIFCLKKIMIHLNNIGIYTQMNKS